MKKDEFIALTAMQLAYKWDAADHIEVVHEAESSRFRTFLKDCSDASDEKVEVASFFDLLVVLNTEAEFEGAEDDVCDWIFRVAAERIRSRKGEVGGISPSLSKTEVSSGLLVLEVLRVLPSWNEVVTVSHVTRVWDRSVGKFVECSPSFAALVNVGMLFENRTLENVKVTEGNIGLLREVCNGCSPWQHELFNENVLKAWLFGLSAHPNEKVNPKMVNILPSGSLVR